MNNQTPRASKPTRFADLRYDSAFKIVFGNPNNKGPMLGVINTLIPGLNIVDFEFDDKEIPGYFIGDRKTVFDLMCHTEDRKQTFVIEMQFAGQKYFGDRALFYSTYPIREQLISIDEEYRWRTDHIKPKRRDYSLSPVYMISILNFDLPHEADNTEDSKFLRDGLVSSYSLRGDLGGGRDMMTDALHFVFLELTRFSVPFENPEWCKTTLEQIAYIFCYASKLEDIPESFKDNFIQQLLHSAEIANFTAEQRRNYDTEMTTEIDKLAQLDYQYDKGHDAGKVEGKIEIVKKMLAKDMAIELICELTGLSKEDVLALRQ